MKKKCDCYEVIKRTRYVYHPLTGQPLGYDAEEGVCNGTKERDNCDCNGDMTKCDFYSEVRKKARKDTSIQDAINHFKHGISHDIFSEPVRTYAKLAVKALEKQLEEE